jgi:hypothetical protein
MRKVPEDPYGRVFPGLTDVEGMAWAHVEGRRP